MVQMFGMKIMKKRLKYVLTDCFIYLYVKAARSSYDSIYIIKLSIDAQRKGKKINPIWIKSCVLYFGLQKMKFDQSANLIKPI